MSLDEVYNDVCARLERGESVPLDLMAELETYGYMFPYSDEDYDMDENYDMEEAVLSPTEVAVSFTDHTHDTVVEMRVDTDGDFWIKAADEDDDTAILISRAGAERLHELLGTALGF